LTLTPQASTTGLQKGLQEAVGTLIIVGSSIQIIFITPFLKIPQIKIIISLFLSEVLKLIKKE
jgi:hypothetical protein